jgi:hypothetical protein
MSDIIVAENITIATPKLIIADIKKSLKYI